MLDTSLSEDISEYRTSVWKIFRCSSMLLGNKSGRNDVDMKSRSYSRERRTGTTRIKLYNSKSNTNGESRAQARWATALFINPTIRVSFFNTLSHFFTQIPLCTHSSTNVPNFFGSLPVTFNTASPNLSSLPSLIAVSKPASILA